MSLDNLVIPKPEAIWRFGRSSPDGIIWSDWHRNTICKGYSNLVGALLTMNCTGSTIPGTYAAPLYIAIGEGAWDGSWDFPNTPPPISASTDTTLTAEIGRQAVHIVGYRQEPPTGHPITEGTIEAFSDTANLYRPIFGASWETTDGISSHGLREVGLFGGPGAGSANSGLLLNMYRYQVQSKTADDPYRLYWEVEFKINWS